MTEDNTLDIETWTRETLAEVDYDGDVDEEDVEAFKERVKILSLESLLERHLNFEFDHYRIFECKNGNIELCPMTMLNEKLRLEVDSKKRFYMFRDFAKKYYATLLDLSSKIQNLIDRSKFEIKGDYEHVTM
jgi:hypothetical protein